MPIKLQTLQYTLVTHLKDTQLQYWYKVVREANKYLEGSKTNLVTNLSSGDQQYEAR